MARLYIPLSQNTSAMTFAERDGRKAFEAKRKQDALKLVGQVERQDVKEFIIETCFWIQFTPDQLDLLRFYMDEQNSMNSIRDEVNLNPSLLDDKQYRVYVRGQEAKTKMAMKLLGITEGIVKASQNYKTLKEDEFDELSYLKGLLK